LEEIKASGCPPEGWRWIDVGDRGSDIYGAMVAAGEVKHDFLFRVGQNRIVWVTSECDRLEYLRDLVDSLPSQGSDVVEIPSHGGRAARTAKVDLAAGPVCIPPPRHTLQRSAQPVVSAWVHRILNPDPPRGVEPLEWILLCSVPTFTIEDIKERRDWYACRWTLEVFPNIEKNGCSEEDRRFETAERMEACLAILSVVAVRIFQPPAPSPRR
jgi:hypothetical protein